MNQKGEREKMLGRVLLIVILFTTHSLYSYITLEVQSFTGRKVTEVAVGEAFVVKISTDEVDRVQELNIAGIEKFAAQKTGLTLITLNGNKTAQITYQVQIDKPGTYSIGPAFFVGGSERSDAVNVQVQTERVTDNVMKRKKDTKDGVLLQLAVDRETVFVGQKIKTRLRAYVPQSEDITLDQVISNEPPTIQTTEKHAPTKRVESMNGISYIVYEWQWDTFPKEPGSLIIPAYFIDYAKALPMPQGFGGLAFFFGSRYERLRSYSNALTLNVLPLPEPHPAIDGIGQFVAFRARIHPAIAKKYEGIVLTLILQGEGNMESITEPVLKGLPESFTYYFSKSSVHITSAGQEKIFEYIVQGKHEGDFEIPAQSFVFFDPEGSTYNTLHTEPLQMQILPEQTSASIIPETYSSAENDEKKNGVLPELSFERSEESFPMRGALSLPWLLFLLGILPCLFFSYTLLHSDRFLKRMLPFYIKRRAYAKAYAALTAERKKQDVRKIHHIFAEFFADRTQSDRSPEDIIKNTTWPDEKKTAWQQFYDNVTKAAYGSGVSSKDVLRLAQEAEIWLSELDRVM